MSGFATFKNIRVLLLLSVLFFVALSTWQAKSRTTSWQDPLWLVIYPINGDGSEVTRRYIDSLNDRHFESIETFMADQANAYGVSLKNPVKVKLGPEINEFPPEPPESTNVFSIMWWSLQIQYWASSITDRLGGPPSDIKMFVIYYDVKSRQQLDHSLGLQKGLLGVVNAYATKIVTEYNNVVILHELMHTVGASDKYDYTTGQPVFPDGYAEPDLDPLYPQSMAELMAGKIPETDSSFEHPDSLLDVLVGELTAEEINWTQ